MQFDFSLMKQQVSYEHDDAHYSLKIWGKFWENPPQQIMIDNVDIDSLQALNFDGGYLAYYENKENGLQIVFRSHEDLFTQYYVEQNGCLYFSDDFYSLMPLVPRKLHWNLQAIADYFEDSWNNIVKYDRTPIQEILRMDVWQYMHVYSGGGRCLLR